MRTESDLRRALAELADTAPGTARAAGQIHLRGSALASTRQPWRRSRVVLAACLTVVLMGILAAWLVTLTSEREPAGPTLDDRYFGSLTIEPSTVRPGDWLTLYFADEGIRGVDFTLDAWTGSAWELTYNLFSDHYPPAGRWWRKADGPRAVPDLGITGPGGERVIVPPIATPGVYRLCTRDNNGDAAGSLAPARKACGLVTVN